MNDAAVAFKTEFRI